MTPLGEGTLMDKDGYYLYVRLDFSQSIAEFYAVELRKLDEQKD